jgi:hypothetical protein
MITSFVMVMMLLIEILNIRTKGKLSSSLQKSPIKQLFTAIMIGIIPGCLGPYAVVSMYTHNIFNLGALVAASVASTGDEAFVMLSLFPAKSMLLFAILIGISLISGIVVNMIFGNRTFIQQKVHFQIHQHEVEKISFSYKSLVNNFKQLSFTRAILFFGLIMFIIGIATGELGHEKMHDHGSGHSEIDWVSLMFISVAIFTLWAVSVVSQHFLDEHLWGHIIKKHFVKVFLWTLGALIAIEVLTSYVHFEDWVHSNHLIVLVLALLIGVIPISGPHLLFVTLFAQGTIPFSILLANSIVQDGHGGLPLIAESKRSFFLLKAITITIGLVFGLIGFYMGW